MSKKVKVIECGAWYFKENIEKTSNVFIMGLTSSPRVGDRIELYGVLYDCVKSECVQDSDACVGCQLLAKEYCADFMGCGNGWDFVLKQVHPDADQETATEEERDQPQNCACGRVATLYRHSKIGHDARWVVRCRECPRSTGLHSTPEGAQEEWRETHDALQVEVALPSCICVPGYEYCAESDGKLCICMRCGGGYAAEGRSKLWVSLQPAGTVAEYNGIVWLWESGDLDRNRIRLICHRYNERRAWPLFEGDRCLVWDNLLNGIGDEHVVLRVEDGQFYTNKNV